MCSTLPQAAYAGSSTSHRSATMAGSLSTRRRRAAAPGSQWRPTAREGDGRAGVRARPNSAVLLDVGACGPRLVWGVGRHDDPPGLVGSVLAPAAFPSSGGRAERATASAYRPAPTVHNVRRGPRGARQHASGTVVEAYFVRRHPFVFRTSSSSMVRTQGRPRSPTRAAEAPCLAGPFAWAIGGRVPGAAPEGTPPSRARRTGCRASNDDDISGARWSPRLTKPSRRSRRHGRACAASDSVAGATNPMTSAGTGAGAAPSARAGGIRHPQVCRAACG